MKMLFRRYGAIFLVLAISSCSQHPSSTSSAETTDTISPDTAKAIAEQAWIYALPMMNNYRSMYLYALDSSYVDYAGGFNRFKNYAKSFTDKDTSVMTPNNDTPYSWAILNLTDEPVILEVPPVPDRYYSFQFIDLYTYNFNYVGTRTTGDKAGRYLIAGPEWKATDTIKGINKIITSETNLVTLLGRTELKIVKGDIENVKKIQSGFKLIPLHEYTKQPAPAHKEYALPFPKWNPAVVDNASFIGLFNNLLQYCPVNPVETELRKRFSLIGIEPGKGFDSASYSAAELEAINQGVENSAKELREGTDKIGNATDLFGTREMLNANYMNRALGAAAGLFGNTKDEAIYIGTRSDSSGKFLSGKNKYTITFKKGQTPPDKYFWSVTIYELPGRGLVNNPINRYSIGNRTTGLKYEKNGDLKIYIQNTSPGKGEDSNWLPAPAGSFYYLIRIYGPEQAIIDGSWKAPQPVQIS
jgi:hypothetical protein